MTPRILSTVRRRLLQWYDTTRRDLPWRHHPTNAYYQWLAECMLQQTQVATVIPYFERFIAQFPTVFELARADLDDVLREWAGLGYYSRARNLHAAAVMVCNQFDGAFPDNVTDLQRLPGIGRYTAGAIASIAFDKPAPILDGNVKRVLARWYAIDADMDDRSTIQNLWALSEGTLPRRRCGDFNQALMELGATVCTPRDPQCTRCPVAAQCAAHISHRVDAIPRPRRRRPPEHMTMVVAALEHNGELLLRRRPQNGLWGGLWELPAEPHGVRKTMAVTLALILKRVGIAIDKLDIPRRPLAAVGHQLTHRTVRFCIFPCSSRGPRRPVCNASGRRWVARDRLGEFGLGRAQKKVISAVVAHHDA